MSNGNVVFEKTIRIENCLDLKLPNQYFSQVDGRFLESEVHGDM